jgi:sugar lactone lactonase YvrE
MRTINAGLALDASPQHGEGPWWDWREGVLYWVDMVGRSIHRSDLSRGTDVPTGMPELVAAVVGRARGGLLVLLANGFATYQQGHEVSWLRKCAASKPPTRFNDGKCDLAGRLLGGTRATRLQPGLGSLYRFDARHRFRRLVAGLTASNGIAWSGDGRTLYLVDSATRLVHVYEYDSEEGLIVSEREPIEIPSEHGAPDGMTIDVDGCLWIALYGAAAVRRYTPRGLSDVTVTLPVTGVTSCAFGGADFRDLYITTSPYSLSEPERAAQPNAGSIFACRPGVGGRLEPCYAG